MDETVNIHQAKTHLSRLLDRVRRGQSITIAKAGTPVARLVPLDRGRARAVRETAAPPVSPIARERGHRLRRFLEHEVWPAVPEGERGRAQTRAEEDAILGYGPEGA